MRAQLPRYFRFAAVAITVVTIFAVGIGFYRARNRTEFRMKGFPTELSKDVVAEVNGYERREAEDGVVKYFVKADRAVTFADNHMELENAYLEIYDPNGQGSDKITADKAVYVPEEQKNFTAYFAGSVKIHTRDELKVRTEQVTYKKATEIATAEEHIEFERDNVHGKSFGAVVSVPQKRLELLRDVEIEAMEPQNADAQQAFIKTGYAAYDQLNEVIDMQQSVDAKTASQDRNTDIRSDRAKAYLTALDNGRDLSRLELFDNVTISSRQGGGEPTNISSGYALYEKAADKFDLRRGVHIVTVEDNSPTNIRSDEMIYEQSRGIVNVKGNAEITQGPDLIKGDHITAELYPNKKLRSSVVRGSGYLRQNTPDRTTEVSANELRAAFGEDQQLLNANALGSGSAVLTPAAAADYSKVTMNAPNAIRVVFKGKGMIDTMITDGRTTILLDVPDNSPDAASKKVTADSVRTIFNAAGTDIAKAEAVGSAELVVQPLHSSAENYRTIINAPRFDCEFFPTGNNAKQCIAATKAAAVRKPTVSGEGRGDQTIRSDVMTAHFHQETRDLELLQASGGAKFTELDRSAVADEISFAQGDQTVRLRGGEPTVWDSSARAKAREIDWDTKNQRSYLRGGVSTTYYSQKQTGGAAPFSESDKPVFITAENGEFDHRAETGVYAGNARGWQENNYVRAERFLIRQREGQFVAEETVQSLLYSARRKENGRETNVPVYASAQKMSYNRDSRVLRYEGGVDIRQGTDRIIGGIANVLLDKSNEVARTDVETNVVITQPNRRASGDYAQYIAADESVILRGRPAQVDDAESGSTSGGELTIFLKNNRVIGEGKTKQNAAGRTRSVYKVRN